MAKVLDFQLQHHSFQRNPRADLLQNGLVGSPFAVQGTLKSLLQHHSSKVSILQRSAFFTVQLSHPYMTTGSTWPLPQDGPLGKDSDAGRDWGQEEKGTTKDEMAGWHHGLDGRESD